MKWVPIPAGWYSWQMARVRSVDPSWKPQRSLTSTIEGEIAHQQSILRQGEAHLRSLTRRIGDNGGPPLEPLSLPSLLPPRTIEQVLAPGGQPAGFRVGRAGLEVRTLSQRDFDEALLLLTNGANERLPGNSYTGTYYDLPDRCVIGVRISPENGLTIDIIEPGTQIPFLREYKFHRR